MIFAAYKFRCQKNTGYFGVRELQKTKNKPPKNRDVSTEYCRYFPPPPQESRQRRVFFIFGFSKSRAVVAIPRGEGGIRTVFWRDVPIFGGFVFCFLQLSNPKKPVFFQHRNIQTVKIIFASSLLTLKKHFFIYPNYLYKQRRLL